MHGFLSAARGRAGPCGIYDPAHHRGTVSVGFSGDTAQFAVATSARWWQTEGQALFQGATAPLILATGGGSNDCRNRSWTHQIQERLCDGLGQTVTVCPYPTGCSTWNPIEHRLFGPISPNWAGKPLHTAETMLAYLRGTTTTTGLAVRADSSNQPWPLYTLPERHLACGSQASPAFSHHATVPPALSGGGNALDDRHYSNRAALPRQRLLRLARRTRLFGALPFLIPWHFFHQPAANVPAHLPLIPVVSPFGG